MKSFRAFMEEMRMQERVWFRDDVIDMAIRHQRLDALKARMKKKRKEADGSGDELETHYVDIPE